MSLFSRLVLALTQAGPVERLITTTRPGRSLARRFVAGDTLDDAVGVSQGLNDAGFLVSLDLLGEEVTDARTAAKATDEYLMCLDRIRSDKLEANISIKPTQLGLAIDERLALENISSLAAAATAVGTTVTVDMEDSRYTEATVRMYEKAQAEHGNLGIALQSCLRRTPADLDRLAHLGGHIRLCKGAYVEPEEVAFQAKREVDAAYEAQLRRLMAFPLTKPAVASHDGHLVGVALALANGRSLPFEFQMLYGVRPEMQRELVAAGYPLRVYLPFGSEWYPYLTRRLAERPANAWFFIRALFGR
jgi:proline dehydrogenase